MDIYHRHTSPAIWTWLECVFFCFLKWILLMFLLCKGVHSKQWLSSNTNFAWTTLMFILVNTKHVKTTFVLTLMFNLTFGYTSIFKELFTYIWLETWNNLHILDARWLLYCGLNNLTWEFMKVLNFWSCTHMLNCTSIPFLFHVDLSGEYILFGDKTYHSFCGSLQLF